MPVVDEPLLMGGRYVERADLDKAVVNAFRTDDPEIPEIATAIDLAGPESGGRWAAPTGWPIRRKGRFGQRGGRCDLHTENREIPEIAFAIDPTDSNAGGRWAAPTERPISERADMDNAAVDAFYPPRMRDFANRCRGSSH